MQAKKQFFLYTLFQVFHQVSSQLPLGGGGGLFSFLAQKSASKVPKTRYFAYFSGQWVAPPSLATVSSNVLNLFLKHQFFWNVLCEFV